MLKRAIVTRPLSASTERPVTPQLPPEGSHYRYQNLDSNTNTFRSRSPQSPVTSQWIRQEIMSVPKLAINDRTATANFRSSSPVSSMTFVSYPEANDEINNFSDDDGYHADGIDTVGSTNQAPGGAQFPNERHHTDEAPKHDTESPANNIFEATSNLESGRPTLPKRPSSYIVSKDIG